jgi:S1-C subfamily serine protease
MDGLLALSDELATAADRAGRAVVEINARPRRSSTGVHWRSGLIVTAHHTVHVDDDVSVTGPDGRTMAAKVAGRDPGLDLAFLTVDAPDLPVADIGDSTAVRVGHIVLALGAGPRASWGIVSVIGAGRPGRGPDRELFSLDLTLYPGFSGGPLVDARGRVLGLNTSGMSRHLRLAIPAGAVNRLADELARRGRLPRAYLGVGTQLVRLPDSLRERLGLEQQTAIIVVDVQPQSPASSAGLLIGDVIVAMAGTPIREPEDLHGALRPERVGGRIIASIMRGGELRDVEVTVGERPRRH